MKIIEQDILTVEGPCVVGHQVNCQGVMGSGLAKQIRAKWPKAYQMYRAYCGELQQNCLGKCNMVAVVMDLLSPVYVANLFGQESYGRKGIYTDYDALTSALNALNTFATEHNLQVYLPFNLGCGFGGGNWNKVLHIIETECPGAIICKLPDSK